MMKTKSKPKSALLAVFLIVLLVFTSGTFMLLQKNGQRANAAVTPAGPLNWKSGEFRDEVGSPFTYTMGGADFTAQNYKGGYVIYEGNSTSGTTKEAVPLKRVTAATTDVGPTVESFTAEEIETATDTITGGGSILAFSHGIATDGGGFETNTDYFNAFGLSYDTLFNGYEIEKYSGNVKNPSDEITATSADEGFLLALREAYLKLYVEGLKDDTSKWNGSTYDHSAFAPGKLNLGLATGNAGVWVRDGAVITQIGLLQKYWHSSSNWRGDHDGYFVYNPLFKRGVSGVKESDRFFYARNKSAEEMSWPGGHKNLGRPVSNEELAGVLRQKGYTIHSSFSISDDTLVQLFEKAIVVSNDDGGHNRTIGGVEFNENTLTLSPSVEVNLKDNDEIVFWKFGSKLTNGYKTDYVSFDADGGTHMHQFYNYTSGAVYAYVNKSLIGGELNKDNAASTGSGTVQLGGMRWNMTKVTAWMAGKTADGAKSLTTLRALSSDSTLYFKPNAVDDENIVRIHDGMGSTSANNVAAKLISGGSQYDSADDLLPLYKAKYAALIGDGFAPGIAFDGIKTHGNFIVQPMNMGDSTGSFEDGGSMKARASWLYFSPTNDEVYFIHSEFINAVFGGTSWSEIGDFISDSHKSVTPVSGKPSDAPSTMKVLLATGGYFYKDNGGTVKWVAGQEWDATNNLFKAAPTFTSIYGAKTDDAPIVHSDGFTYQNLNNGYAKYKYNSTSERYEITYKANFNVSKPSDSLIVTPVAIGKYILTADTNWAVAPADGGNDDVTKILGTLTEEQKTALVNKFKGAAETAVTGGFSIGVTKSWIKSWAGFVIMEFVHGEGTMWHDNPADTPYLDGRRDMSILVYNVAKNEVYCVGLGGREWAESMGSLGAPVSDMYSSISVSINGGAAETLNNVQFFAQGYFFYNPITKKGEKITKGYKFIEGTPNQLSSTPAPSLPGEFGALNATVELENGSIYLNYANGCVLARPIAGTNGYVYTKYFGRQWNNSTKTIEKIPFENLVAVVGTIYYNPASEIPALPEGKTTTADFVQLFIDAYKYWYEQDVILGVIDGEIGGWTGNAYIQQFKFGDSKADPFGDSRDNFAALSYNPNTKKVHLIIDGAVTALVSLSNVNVAMPIEDPRYIEELGVWVQRYSMTSAGGNDYFVWRDELGTRVRYSDIKYEDFIAAAKLGSSHGKDPDKGYITVGDDGAISYNALHLPEEVAVSLGGVVQTSAAALGALGLAGALRFRDEKKGNRMLRRKK